jgi:signal transduction histidine kinase
LRFVVLDSSGMQVMGDRELLVQMFVNLIENAINHSGTGTLIELSLARRDSLLLARVADNGVGIPTAEHKKVFRRLYRLDKSRTSAGSGLGLSLVKAVADLHSAEVALEDNQPGTRVLVRFPVLR